MGADTLDAALLARTVMMRADVLAGFSEEPGRLTRRFATPAMREAGDAVAAWMREAGMAVRVDNIGNVIGRYEGSEQEAPTLLLGSHLDTVRDAGKYDGPLGVLVALAAVEQLFAAGRRLPFALEVLSFADEEGARYGTAYLGSKVFAGTFPTEYLERWDDRRIPMAEAIRAAGGDPARLSFDRRGPGDLLGYCEVHIEQGPVLEAEGLPVGVVSSIIGQSRLAVRFAGEARHAGTVPPVARRDALCGAAEFVLEVEGLAREREGLVATVGRLDVEPGVGNVIPGLAVLSLDVRHPEDAVRLRACRELQNKAEQIASRRALGLVWQVLQEAPGVKCDATLAGLLAAAVEDRQLPVRYLASGAGHDAVPMSELTGVAMLFVRCRGGISHNPAESVAEADVAVAIAVLGRFLELLAAREAGR